MRLPSEKEMYAIAMAVIGKSAWKRRRRNELLEGRNDYEIAAYAVVAGYGGR